MRKFRMRFKAKIYPIIWTIILLLSVYILIRFTILSFSEDMGQARFRDALIAKFCNSMIESGACLISYTAQGEDDAYAFPVSMIENEISLEKFTEKGSVINSIDKGEYSWNERSVTDTMVYETDLNDTNWYDRNVDQTSTSEGNIVIYKIEKDTLGLEFLLTNGEVLQSATTGILLGDEQLIDGQLQIGYLKGNISQMDIKEDIENDEESVETVSTGDAVDFTLDQLKDTNYLIRNFYTVDASTTISETLFDADELLNKDMTMKQSSDAPQILIYHTHSQESYADSKQGEIKDTVVGIGDYLAEILQENYGYNVIHDTTPYDTLDPELGYKAAYSKAEEGILKILEENPTIEVIIDLHRNSGEAKTTMVDGKETAQVMLFNGLCRDQNGPITYLDNPYLQDNLAFSFQLQLKSKERYPDLFIKNYLKCYRFNMHFRPKCMLVELGTYKNTVESALNAMIPFSKILDDVLRGE